MTQCTGEKAGEDGRVGSLIRQPILAFLVVFGAVAVLGAMAAVQRAMGLPEWVGKVTLALAPLVPTPIIIGAAVRSYRRLDELQRRIQGEALVWGFVLGSILVFTWGSIEMAMGLPRVGWIWVGPIFGGSWLLGLAIARRTFS